MIRLSNVKLPLNHDKTAINKAVLSTLNIRKEQLLSVEILSAGTMRVKKPIYRLFIH